MTDQSSARSRDADLLHVRDLTVDFVTRDGVVHAVDQVSLVVRRGEIVGLVGESGSGKSTVGLSLMRLLPPGAREDPRGQILLDGQDLLKVRPAQMRRIRGRVIAMTFQDPMTFLNPVVRVGEQIVEAIREHQHISRSDARDLALQAISDVLITEPDRIFRSFPFQLSGGMRQRILIAIALSCRPSLVVADEPTTALDVTVQREILDMLRLIRDRFGTAILLITHDLGIVAETCDRVYVMYAGQIFEHGRVERVLTHPRNPYTGALLRSAQSIDEYRSELYALAGNVPSLVDLPSGCLFRERCPAAFDRCVAPPPLFADRLGDMSRCWLAEGDAMASGGRIPDGA